jgi:hypothetical protein
MARQRRRRRTEPADDHLVITVISDDDEDDDNHVPDSSRAARTGHQDSAEQEVEVVHISDPSPGEDLYQQQDAMQCCTSDCAEDVFVELSPVAAPHTR